MLKSEAERIIKKACEESGAQFTEEQIQALCAIVTKIAATTVEEAFASWRPGSGKGGYFAG
jgi:histone H3/H4